MAKKVEQENPFRGPGRQFQPDDNSDLERGPVTPIGIGLTAGEREALDMLAEKYAVKRHALLKLAVRLLINGVRAGTIDLTLYVKTPQQPANYIDLP